MSAKRMHVPWIDCNRSALYNICVPLSYVFKYLKVLGKEIIARGWMMGIYISCSYISCTNKRDPLTLLGQKKRCLVFWWIPAEPNKRQVLISLTEQTVAWTHVSTKNQSMLCCSSTTLMLQAFSDCSVTNDPYCSLYN